MGCRASAETQIQVQLPHRLSRPVGAMSILIESDLTACSTGVRSITNEMLLLNALFDLIGEDNIYVSEINDVSK